MSNETKYIWMDGELVETAKATVPFLTSALHYSSAVFEGIRCYNAEKGPAVFRLKEHMRLDKKRRQGEIHFALPEKIGSVRVGVTVPGWEKLLEMNSPRSM